MIYQCPFCGRVLFSETLFMQHLLRVHCFELSIVDRYYINDSESGRKWYEENWEIEGLPSPTSLEEWLKQFMVSTKPQKEVNE